MKQVYNFMLVNFKTLDLSTIKNFIHSCYKSTFVRQVAGTFTTRVFLIGVGLITSVLTARILGPEGLGLFAVAVAVGAIGVQFGNIGLHASNTYYVAKSPDLLTKLVGNSLLISFGLGGAGAVLIWSVFHLIPEWSPLPDILLFLALLWVPIGLSYMLMQNLLIGTYQIRAYNIIEIIVKTMAVVLILIIFFTTIPSVEKIFSVTLLALCTGFIGSLYLLWKKAQSLPQISLNLFRNSIGYGLKAYLASFFAFLVLRVDILMVNQILGEKSAGFYSIAANMADMVYMLPVVIGTILFPKLSALKEGKWKLTRNVVIGVGLILLPLIGLAVLLATPVVSILYGESFLPAVSPFIWLMPGVFFLSLETIYAQYLNSIGIPFLLVIFWIIVTTINVVLNLLMLPIYGIIGAAFASTISYTIIFLFVIIYSHNKRYLGDFNK